MFKKLILVSALALSLNASALDHAGSIKNIEGTVEIVRGGVVTKAAPGTKIYPGDELRTSKNSNVGVMMRDDSRMALSSNTKLVVERFNFNPNTNEGNITLSVIKGGMAMISGLLTKHSPETAIVKTPTSTAGIRGTYFYVEVP